MYSVPKPTLIERLLVVVDGNTHERLVAVVSPHDLCFALTKTCFFRGPVCSLFLLRYLDAVQKSLVSVFFFQRNNNSEHSIWRTRTWPRRDVPRLWLHYINALTGWIQRWGLNFIAWDTTTTCPVYAAGWDLWIYYFILCS